MSRNEFKPPSDMNPDGAADGGGTSSLWKWVGIGCGIFVIIVGIALAAGAWKTVSCCNQAMDSARQAVEAGKFSTQFASELATGDFDKVRSQMTSKLKAGLSADQLEKKWATYQHLFSASSPRMTNVSLQRAGEEAARVWETTVVFTPPSGNEKLVLVETLISRGKGDDQAFLVDGLTMQIRSRDIAAEGPSVEVKDFHRQIRAGDYETAYRHMTSAFDEHTSLAEFREFIDGQNEVFRTGEVVVKSVVYGSKNEATVVVRLRVDNAPPVKVEYQLVQSTTGMKKWGIAGVTPSYHVAGPPADVDAGDAGEPAADDPDRQDGGAP